MNSIVKNLLALSFCLIASLSYSQSVILINGVPTEVTIDKSEIINIKGTVENHMNEYIPESKDVFIKTEEDEIKQKKEKNAKAAVIKSEAYAILEKRK